MHIKVTTTRTRRNTYRYVKVVSSTWHYHKGAGENVIATLGTLDEVLRSRDVLIKGLTDLKSPELYRQKRPGRSGRILDSNRPATNRQKGRKSI